MAPETIPPLIRDVLLFAIGAAGLAYQTVVQHGASPHLIGVFTTFLIYPAFTKKGGRNVNPLDRLTAVIKAVSGDEDRPDGSVKFARLAIA